MIDEDKNEAFKQVLQKTNEYWQNKYRIAVENMKAKQRESDDVLIEIATQHPLVKGKTPSKEFIERMKRGIELYHAVTVVGRKAKICIFGSKHMYKSVVDQVSLSTAGKNYLIKMGIPKEDIFADETIEKYKGKDGVYNGADECYVTAKVFEDGSYGELYEVCSVNQAVRKSLNFIEFGYVPKCYTIVCDNMFHSNLIDEIFYSLNHVLYFDHDWQNPESEAFLNSRLARKPIEIECCDDEHCHGEHNE